VTTEVSAVSSADADTVLRLEHVTKHFRLRRTGLRSERRVVHAVDDVSLTLGSARTLGIVGESGCGKSTLGRLIAGLVEPTSGRVTVSSGAGHGDGRRRSSVQMVFQDPMSALDPRMTVGASIAEAVPGIPKTERQQRVREALDTVRLPQDMAHRFPHELSGGQQQRACIARALIDRPPLVLLDEAVSSLDASLQSQTLRLLADLQQSHAVGYVFISHDLRAVRALSHQVAVMYLGQVVESAPSHEFDRGLLHPYSVALRSAEPELDVRAGRGTGRIILGGEPPSAVDPPEGCRFAARCPIVRERCREQAPELREVATDHRVACHFPGELRSPVTAVSSIGTTATDFAD
jgi:peptide/nickel transport system ATP-binding protein/oligopeptide transport system ATP-binding protein